MDQEIHYSDLLLKNVYLKNITIVINQILKDCSAISKISLSAEPFFFP